MRTVVFLSLLASLHAQPAFYGRELLGRVSDTSVTVNIAPVANLEFYFEYGLAPATYTAKTPIATTAAPVHTTLDNLQPNTRYYYRLRYREPGAPAFLEGPERTFHTQRPRGSTFTFALQFDPHMDENSDADVYRLTLRNQLAAAPDFLIDLGDTFMSDKLQPITEPAIVDRVRLLRSFYDISSHSVPLFLSLGNHEGEWGRNLNGTANNVAVWDTIHRKRYFPNPSSGGIFTGDTRVEPLTGVREAYYAWEWGDALFVVLDPYWNRPVAPEASGDWSLTLGRAQYDWLKKTLEASTAQYKFVFAHNLIGGRDMNGPMRGGVEVAKYLEWGGYNMDDTWGFDKARPGWPMPIHQLLVANKVTAFFHGHDHLYAKQDLDGIVYQEGPQPSARNANLGNRAFDYSYNNGTVLGGTGYIRVQVSPAGVKAEYIQTWLPAQENATRRNGMVADTWTIKPPSAQLKMLSAAGYVLGAPVAPESIVAAFGQSLPPGPVVVKDSAGKERTADVLGAVPTQVNFVVPPGTATGPSQVTIGDASGQMQVETVAPALFSANGDGKGSAAAVALRVAPGGAQTSGLTFTCGPAAGSCINAPIDLTAGDVYVSLYGTGLRLRQSLDAISAAIGGEPAEVLYAGPQPAFPGLDQLNLRVPRTLAGRGELPVTLSIATKPANPVTLRFR